MKLISQWGDKYDSICRQASAIAMLIEELNIDLHSLDDDLELDTEGLVLLITNNSKVTFRTDDVDLNFWRNQKRTIRNV